MWTIIWWSFPASKCVASFSTLTALVSVWHRCYTRVRMTSFITLATLVSAWQALSPLLHSCAHDKLYHPCYTRVRMTSFITLATLVYARPACQNRTSLAAACPRGSVFSSQATMNHALHELSSCVTALLHNIFQDVITTKELSWKYLRLSLS